MSSFVFGVGLLLSQFYIFKSGVPQPSHFIMLVPFLFFLAQRKRILIDNYGGYEPLALLLFLYYATCVNLVFCFLRGEPRFLLASLYLMYGASLFFLLQNIIFNLKGDLKPFSFFLFLGVALLFCLALLGFGEYKFYPRYNAYFNDPNQMAFWALCVSSMLLVQKRINNIAKAFVFVFLLYIILKSASRSGLVGFSVLVLGYFFSNFDFSRSRLSPQRAMMVVLGLFLVVGLGYFFISTNVDSLRFLEGRVADVDIGSQAEIRGYTRFVDFPEYALLGAGQGDDSRFNERSTEMHSTWAGLLFYYGLPGLGLILYVVFGISKRLSFSQKLMFFAPMLYSFSTLGFRTPIFWIFISFFYCYSMIEKRHALNCQAHNPRLK